MGVTVFFLKLGCPFRLVSAVLLTFTPSAFTLCAAPEHSSVTSPTHRISRSRILNYFLTTVTGPHLMSSAIDVIDLESGQGAQAAPPAGAFFSLSHHHPLGQKR